MNKRIKPVSKTTNRNKPRVLTDEEHALWQQVALTLSPTMDNPAHGLKEEDFGELFNSSVTTSKPYSSSKELSPTPQKPAAPSYRPPSSTEQQQSQTQATNQNLDDRSAKKLLRGKISIDDRLDLHGMTQAQAHSRLTLFLDNAYNHGQRHVLIITGKGRLSGGILRQLVPAWLQEAQCAIYVSAFRKAHITHGGDGALYVRIRRRR